MSGEVYGDITLDGSLADWSDWDILYRTTPLGWSQEIRIYGMGTGDAYVFAATGYRASTAMTSFWLNTDRDPTTGYQLGGVTPTAHPDQPSPFAGGAEFNVGITGGWKGAPGETVNLYSGAEQETLVSPIDFAFGANDTVEFAVPLALIGAPEAIDLRVDFGSLTWLAPTMTVAAQAETPPVVGGVTLDGSLSDWAPGDRIDMGAGAVAGYDLYATVVDDSYVFALNSPIEIGDNTTFWLNTDLDASTGYQIWGWAGGAEYQVELTPNLLVLLSDTALASQTPTLLSAGVSADRKTIEFAVPLSKLAGAPSATDVLIDINDQVFLPNSYATPIRVAAPDGTMMLDGDISDWAAGTRLDTPATGTAGYALHGDVQGDAFVFAIDSDAVAIGANTTIWLDTDLDRSTGYQIWGFTGGVEYNVNVGADGVARLYTGAAGETFVADLDYSFSADNTTVELAVPKSLLAGAPSAVRVFADVNDNAFLPNSYATMDFIVGSPPVDPPPPIVTYGAVTLDGDIGDWANGTRLQDTNGGGGTAGYAIYGDTQGNAFVFAIDTETVAIGANTTIWLDTDLDRSTGYQIWGYTGGAEYNVNVGADGIARLCTGAAGETFVADLDYHFSEDKTTFELAVSKDMLAGAPAAVRVFADVNDSAFLPYAYNIYDFIVANNPPIVTHGAVTLDGDLGDWTAGTRLDTPATGTPGYALYGDVQGDAFVFAIHSDSVAIGANTTIWLDTNLDRDTGHQIWGFAGGAEYNVNFSTNGVAKLYTGAAGETFIADLDYHFSADNTTVELAVPKSLLAGGPSAARVYADVNDTAYLPNDYANVDFIVGSPPNDPPPPAMTFGAVTVDGDIAEWASDTRLDTPETGTAGYALHGEIQGDAFVFAIDTDSVAIGANTTIWLDTDLDRGTGYQIWGWAGGAEYNVNFGADSVARLYTGAAGEAFVADLDYRFSADNTTVELALLKDLLAGAPAAVRVFADVNDTAFLPNNYADLDFIVSDLPADDFLL